MIYYLLIFQSNAFRLKFAIVNQNKEEVQRWLSEIFSEDYQCSNISDLSNDDDDDDECDSNEEEYVSVHGGSDQTAERTILAINGRNNYFQTLKFRYKANSTRSEARFVRKFANWLDKLTEGLCKEKTHVTEWPPF
jgi:hypothetical protein